MARIARIRTAAGPRHAVEQPDGRLCLIEGDLLGDWRATDQVAPADAERLAPVVPPTIYCIGLNYRRHAEETGAAIPKYPVLFIKSTSALHHPGRSDPDPDPPAQPRGRLRMRTGGGHRPPRQERRARRGPRLCARLHLRQRRQRPRLADASGAAANGAAARRFDTFCPLGPVLVTRRRDPEPERARHPHDRQRRDRCRTGTPTT